MLQTLTAKLKILPNTDESRMLLETMTAYSEACTFVAKKIAEKSLPLNICTIHKEVYFLCRAAFRLPSQMAASTIRTVVASYKSIRTSQAKHSSRFGVKKRNSLIVPQFRKPQVSLVWNRDYSIVWNKQRTERLFSVNTLYGRIRVPFKAPESVFAWAFTKDASFGTAKLIYRHGKFFLHIPVTVEVEEQLPLTQTTTVVGIDRG
ncbi:MAG: transposase, partial [Clostridium sp.]|nr:transposase [Clostridium sp.]